MNDTVFYALLITFLAGISTSLGGMISYCVKPNDMRILAFGMSFSAGVMIYISFMEILPISVDKLSPNFPTGKVAAAISVSLFFLGAFVTALIDRLSPGHVDENLIEESCEIEDENKSHSGKNNHSHAKKKNLHRVGVFTAFALCLHNFPEGLAVFASSLNSFSLSIPIAVAIALHNIPEGLSVALPIYNATGSRKKAFWWATLSGLAEPVGAVVGFFVINSLSDGLTLGVVFALIAGIMVYVALDELLPTAQEYGHGHEAILGTFAGMAVMAASLLFI